VKELGTEIRTFTSLKDLTEYLSNQTNQYKALFEDYSQWLGLVLRDAQSSHKSEEWFQKSAALQKTLKATSKKPAENDKTKKGSKNAKGKEETSCWVQSGDIAISFTEQGQTEILFEAIEKINVKVQEYEKFKGTVQQLARLGLGTTVNYIVYIEEDVPKKIVLKQKTSDKGDEAFKFMAELSVPAYYNSSESP
jgi:glutamate mutase epsilon subunit